ncbi:MAG TPA: pilus assembly protein TadG-related protein, partial [Acidimicrobiales bacterium]|nr:pilus assembly protein TadG-related protein [Acidimicrobiales bacterium]
MSHRIRRSERGATLILVALSLAASLSVVGVVVDGGSAFAERRQMQNSADAAAMSAARAFDRLTAGNEASVHTAAVTTATANGADAASVTCRFVDEVLTDVGSCPTNNNGTAVALKALATGVRVTTTRTRSTAFIRVAGIKDYSATARATAQIQGLRSGNSPFVLCAVHDSDPRADGDGQVANPAIIMPDNSMNPAAIGVTYELQDPNAIGCGQGSDFKGLSDSAESLPTPGPWVLESGDHGINVAKAVIAGASACSGGLVDGCVIAVPLCHATDPPTSGMLYCQRFAAFQIVDADSASRIEGTLLGNV